MRPPQTLRPLASLRTGPAGPDRREALARAQLSRYKRTRDRVPVPAPPRMPTVTTHRRAPHARRIARTAP